MSHPPGVRGEAGYGLIEVLVACVLVAIVLVGLSPVTLRMAAASSQLTEEARRGAALASAAAWVQSQPYAAVTTGCATLASGSALYDRCLLVVSTVPNRKDVTITVTEVGRARSSTTTVLRTQTSPPNPLKKPGL